MQSLFIRSLLAAALVVACSDDDKDGATDACGGTCSAEQICDAATKQCVAKPCEGHTQCGEGKLCLSGACVPENLGVGDPCQSDAECRTTADSTCLDLSLFVPGVEGECVVPCVGADLSCPKDSTCIELSIGAKCVRSCDASAPTPAGCATDQYECVNEGSCGRHDLTCITLLLGETRQQDTCFPDCRVYTNTLGYDPCPCDTECNPGNGFCRAVHKTYGEPCYSEAECLPQGLCYPPLDGEATYCMVPCDADRNCPTTPGTSQCLLNIGGTEFCTLMCNAGEEGTPGSCPAGHLCHAGVDQNGDPLYVCAPPYPTAQYGEACREPYVDRRVDPPQYLWPACAQDSECLSLAGFDRPVRDFCAADCSNGGTCPASPAGGQCFRFGDGAAFCLMLCDTADVGTQGTCPTGLTCLEMETQGGPIPICMPGCRG